MSQYSNNKGKDTAGKKYASFNHLSQNFRNSKGDNKTGAQGNRSHGGMQSLGKVQGRRVLKPVNLASLKRENLGNDPRVNLVPSGSAGWGKKEPPPPNQVPKQDVVATTGTTKGPPTSGKPENQQEISLRPNAGVVPSGKSPTEGGAKTWGSKVNPEQSSDSPYFQKEFPTLGQDGEPRDLEKGEAEGGDQNANRQAMAHPMMNGQKWMENASGMPTPPVPFPGYPYALVPGPGGRSVAVPYYFPYSGPGGKMPPFDPNNFMQRMPRPVGPPQNRGGKLDRPVTVKDSDLKSLDQEKDDNGWAAAQDEVDYNAKLNFDESDDSDEDRPSKRHDQKQHRDGAEKSKDKEHPNWPGYPPFHPSLMNWRMQLPPGYEPPQGGSSGGPSGYPFPPYPFYMPQFGMPPNMQQGQANKEKPEGDNADKQEDNKNIDKSKFKPFTEDEDVLKRKAAAQAKLQALEEKMKIKNQKQDDVTVEDLDRESSSHLKPKNETDTVVRPPNRSRNNSEASDSSRRSGKDVPPRFQRKRSTQSEMQEADHEDKNTDRTHMRIMERKESSESQKSQSSLKEGNVKQNWEDNLKKPDDVKKTSRQESQQTTENEGGKSVQRARAPPKGGLKDLSETRKEKDDKTQRKFETGSDKTGKQSNQRYEMRSTKGPKSSKDDGEYRNKEESVTKPSPWNVAGSSEKTSKPSSKPTKSLVEIQKEEEEQAKHVGTKQANEDRSPDMNKFRSDNFGRYQPENPSNRANNRVVDGTFDPSRDRPRRGGEGRFDKGERRPRNDAQRSGPNDRRERAYPDKRNQQQDRRDNNRQDNQDMRDVRQDYQDRRDNRQDHRDKREGDRCDNQTRRDEKRDYSERRNNSDKREDRCDNVDKRDERRDDRRDRRDDSRKEDRNNRRGDRRDRGERADRRGDYDNKRDTREDRRGPREPREDRSGRKPKEETRNTKPTVFTPNADGAANIKTASSETKVDGSVEQATTQDTKNQLGNQQPQSAPSGSAKAVNDKREERVGNFRNERRTNNRDNRDNRRQYERGGSERKSSYRGDDTRPTDSRKPRNDEPPRNDWQSRNERKEKHAPTQSVSDAPKGQQLQNKDAPKKLTEEGLNVVKAIESSSEPKSSTKEVTAVSVESLTTEEADIEKKSDTKKDESSTYQQRSSSSYRNERSERRPRQDRDRESRYDRGGERGSEYGGRGRGRGRRGSSDRYPRGGGREQSFGKYDGEPSAESTERGDSSYAARHQQKRPRSNVVSTTNWEDTPPRFRQQSGRGRGESARGGRGRGRGRGGGVGSGERKGTPTSERDDDAFKKNDNESERYYSANEDEVPASSEEKGRRSSSSSQTRGEREKRGSLAYKTGRTRGAASGGGRGASRGGRSGKEPFLGNRQQVGVREKQRKGGDESTLPAADKNHLASRATTISTSTHQQTHGGTSNLEEISMHSPPKKVKSSSSADKQQREEKKRDISREFDLSNIAGVVIIDDIPSAAAAQEAHASKVAVAAEDDGFTMVTSKKQLREQRDRAREEEKKKLKIEQKKEAAALAAATTSRQQQKERQTTSRKDAKEQQQQTSTTPVSAAGQTQTTFATTIALKLPVETTTITTATTTPSADNLVTVRSSSTTANISSTTTTSVPPAPASNAAMAAIGIWEPAQSLMMRTSQQQQQTLPTISSSEQQIQSKPATAAVSAPQTNVNAWKRPLTLTTTSTTTSAPDPRAVGTGKPSSLQTNTTKSTVVQPIQQVTPESASPLVTPPTLTPIGSTSSVTFVNQPPPKSSFVSTATTTTTIGGKNTGGTKLSGKGDKISGANVNKALKKDTVTEKRQSDKRETSDTGKKDSSNKRDAASSSANKKSLNRTEKPPRFQNTSRDQQQRKDGRDSDAPQRGGGGRGSNNKYDDKKRGERNDRDRTRGADRDRDDYKSRKRNSDRQQKGNFSKSTNDPNNTAKSTTRTSRNERNNVDSRQSTKPSQDKKKSSTQHNNNNNSGIENKKQISSSSASANNDNDSVFVSATPADVIPLKGNTSRSSLSDADKVVGSKKPSLKSQSSIGSCSYIAGESTKTLVNEEDVEIKIQADNFQEPSTFLSQQERDERSANQTARSIIKSLNDDEEKSLETRSLPGTPPLAVKIPQPTLSGPSSDPGRAPSPTSSKAQAPSMDREMNEMNRRLLNTRRVWETLSWSETQGSSSDTQVVVSSSIGGVTVAKNVEKKAAPLREISNEPSSPSKASVEITPITSSTNCDSLKARDEKPVATGFNNLAKRPEQQVCKVKPQQQQPVAMTQQSSVDVDVIRLTQTQSSTDRNLGIGSHGPLSKFMLPRQSALYASSGDNSPYAAESFRSPPISQFASLGSSQVSHSAALSQHALSSLQVGNLYGSGMTWQMMPSSSMQQQSQGQQQGSTIQQQQPKTHITYPTAPNHGSLFTSSASLGAANTSLIMQYDSNFDHQRTNSNMQRQPISIVPLPQHQQSQHPNQQGNGLIGMLPNTVAATGRQAMRRDQLYRNVSSDHLAMLLNQTNTAGLPQHQQHHLLAQQQQAQNTDLTKHVNAKPFEPTTQNPGGPLIANPPIMQQSMHMQQQMVSTIFRPAAQSNQLGTVGHSRQHHVQSMPSHQQQQQQQQQSLVSLSQQRQNMQLTQQHHAPLVAPVIPRQAQPMNMTAKQQLTDRSPNFQQQQQQHYSKTSHHHHQSMATLNSRRQQPMSHVQQLPMSSQSMPNHFNIQQQQQQQRSHQQRVVTAGMNFPSPIQRPSQIPPPMLQQQQQHGNYSALQQQQLQPPQQPPPPPVTDFKKIQRQKMLADTKNYFKQQEQQHTPSSTSTDKEKADEKPLSMNGSTTSKDLHQETTVDSQPIPTQQKNNLKTQAPTVGDSVAAIKRATPSVPVVGDGTTQHNNRRNVPSKV